MSTHPIQTVRDLIKEDYEPRQREPVPDLELPTIEGVLALPNEGLWKDSPNRLLICLGILYLQICQIPEANEQLRDCYRKFERQIVPQWIKLVRTAKRCIRPNQQWNPVMVQVERQLYQEAAFIDDSAYCANVRKILLPWVQEWACSSDAMISFIHLLWAHDVVFSETFTKTPCKRPGVSKKGYKNALAQLKRNDGKINKQYADYLSQVIGGNLAQHWKVLLSPEWDRCKQADRRQAREELRRQGGYSLMREKAVCRAAWCFVQVEILGKTIIELVAEADRREIHLPFNTFYTKKDKDTYFKPFYDALALDGCIKTRKN